ncbi:hypothetical protein N0V88_003126 [Collariella sp. IMI 366227]|nr:hypothetical protein N0V88_003126 [Collariella sp. IMI 366227]
MAAAQRDASEEQNPHLNQEVDQAVDESSDVDGDFASHQKMLSQRRRAAKDCPEARLQKALPFLPRFVPFIRPLTTSDLEACLEYRLTTCPELSLGLFITVIPDQAKSLNIETLPFAQPVETGRADGAVTLLLAHIVSTRCGGDIITDADMDYPKDWRTLSGRSSKDCGHQPEGMTVGLHSLAVLPRVHRCGMGQLIMKAFLDQMKSCKLVERVALICQDHLVSYYERSGYKHVGESKAQFGGGGWHDMVHDLPLRTPTAKATSSS